MQRNPIMIKRRFFCVALLGLCGALVCVTLLVYEYARADVWAGRFLLHGCRAISSH
jgi:hypothetical protein